MIINDVPRTSWHATPNVIVMQPDPGVAQVTQDQRRP
jgi:hypothetical protein